MHIYSCNTVRFRPNFKILTLVYRLLKDIGPLYLRELISRYQPSRSLRSQSKNLLVVPCSRTVSYGSRAFPVAAANLWNNLPDNIREAGDLATFKLLLKTEYFRKRTENNRPPFLFYICAPVITVCSSFYRLSFYHANRSCLL